MTTLSVTLCLIILGVLAARAVWIMRDEARSGTGRPRGIDPGTGYTEIDSNYSSGLGGGHQLTTRVPQDPQEYARAFVPRRNKDDRT